MININDPLSAHLLDIVSDVRGAGLILAGGYGIGLKQYYLTDTAAETLIVAVPTARATPDLDLFLRLELFVDRKGAREVREMLDALNYKITTDNYLFAKGFDPTLDKYKVKVDMLARHPDTADEKKSVKVGGRRVGGTGKPSLGIHGRETEEAFAVEDSPTTLTLNGKKTDGTQVQADVAVPHPYASLNMKVKAAMEWHERDAEEYKPGSEKHVLDVYILTAMLTGTELSEAAAMAGKYRDHRLAKENIASITALFGTEDARGFQEVRRQVGRDFPLDYATFWEGLRQALGAE